jgi:4-diphosphocytidyl-2C-methyl-D-erythritol kinase
VLIVHPGASIPTPVAFKRHAELRNGEYPVVASVISAASLDRWSTLSALAVNDLYEPALERIPALEPARQLMAGGGAMISLLSGSGGALFGIFDSDTNLDPIIAGIAGLGFQSWQTHTLTTWPDQVSRH